jgi:hypothetical protein
LTERRAAPLVEPPDGEVICQLQRALELGPGEVPVDSENSLIRHFVLPADDPRN